MKLKILNLYAGLGGNRKLWGDDFDITAVELDDEIAEVYAKLYPKDKVYVTDAHQFLLDHLNEFDFIWTSPPCQTHSNIRYNLGVRYRGVKPKYPDCKLYEEILLLKYYAKCGYVVENVKPYYEPLIKPDVVLQRHLFGITLKYL